MDLLIAFGILGAILAIALLIGYKYEKGIRSNPTLYAIREEHRTIRQGIGAVSGIAGAVSGIANASMSKAAQKCVPPCSHGKDSASTNPAPKAGHSVACMKNFGPTSKK